MKLMVEEQTGEMLAQEQPAAGTENAGQKQQERKRRKMK